MLRNCIERLRSWIMKEKYGYVSASHEPMWQGVSALSMASGQLLCICDVWTTGSGQVCVGLGAIPSGRHNLSKHVACSCNCRNWIVCVLLILRSCGSTMAEAACSIVHHESSSCSLACMHTQTEAVVQHPNPC